MSELMRIHLHSGWTVKGEDWTDAVKASVPGDLYSDLLAACRMEDPYFRDNELAALKLMEKDYEYRTVFAVPDEMLRRQYRKLRFEGLDTLADLYLNGFHLGSVNNMHRIWEFDAGELLHSADNELRIVFHSPTEYIRRRYGEKKLEGTRDAMRGFPYLRKAHCMFGWDWGPRLPDCGIWRPVSLIAYDTARIDSVYVTQRHEDGAVYLTAEE